MAFTASSLILTGSIDSFMTIIKNCLTSSNWDLLEVNSSSLQPPNSKNGREFIFRSNGASTDPTRFYLNIINQTNNVGAKRVIVMAFAGAKNFDTPVIIDQLSASSIGGAHITASTTTPHNLNVGDFLIIGGNSNPQLNESWGGTDASPTTSFRVEQVLNTSSFTYRSVASTGSGNGGYVVTPYNICSPRTFEQNNAISLAFTAVTSSFSVFMYYDEYRICGCISQSANFQTFYWGEVKRNHIPPKFRDRAFLSVDVLSGNVTASLDRSCDNIRVGQKIWFVHISGSTAGSGSYERTTVTSKPNSSSFGCTLLDSYPSGSIVGEDPLPVCVLGNIGTNSSTENLNTRDIRFLFHINALKETTSVPIGVGSYTAVQDSLINETAVDPDSLNYIQGRYIVAQRTTPPTGFRGRLKGFVSFANGPQTGSQEIIRVGDSSSISDYKNFPASIVDASNYTLALGPGAI